MSEIIENFKVSLIEDGKSPKRIESYAGDIVVLWDYRRIYLWVDNMHLI